MKPFFFLPFDHRSGFVRDVFGKPYPPTPAVGKRVQALKRIIYDGFLLAFPAVAKVGTPAILVDEGADSAAHSSAAIRRMPKRSFTITLATMN